MIELCEWLCQLPARLPPQLRGGQFHMEGSLHDR